MSGTGRRDPQAHSCQPQGATAGSSDPRQTRRGWGTDGSSGVAMVGRTEFRAQVVQPQEQDVFNMLLGPYWYSLPGSQHGRCSWQLRSCNWMTKMEKVVSFVVSEPGGNAHGFYRDLLAGSYEQAGRL